MKTTERIKTRHIFPGSNTCEGFRGFFSDIFDVSRLERLFILKGGPGTGKSSLMRRVGEYAENKGYSVEYCHCSSDPDSLDGLVIEPIGVGVLDGTAPHVVDPVAVGAKDEIINLADGLDFLILRKDSDIILALKKRIKLCFNAAHCWAMAAESTKNAVSASYILDQRRISSEFQNIELPVIFSKDDERLRAKHIYLSALTPDGIVSFQNDNTAQKTWHIDAPWWFDATKWLSALANYAGVKGKETEFCHNPINSSRIDHVIIDDRLYITTQDLTEHADIIDICKLFSCGEKSKIEKRKYDEMIDASVHSLKLARELHNEIEKIYADAMNFDFVDKAYDRIISSI